VNRELKEKARTLAGIKSYITNLRACPGRTPHHRAVRDRRLPPALRDRALRRDGQERSAGPGRSTTASATRSRRIWPSSSRRWRSAAGSSAGPDRQDSPPLPNHRIQADLHTITAADPLPDELRQALEAINGTRSLAH